MMKTFLILPIMIFLHILDDFHLQGVLAKMKQKIYWKKYGPRYSNDYKISLSIHSLEWTFVITIPMLIDSWKRCEVGGSKYIWSVVLYFVILLFNFPIHYAIDDMKANGHEINLVTDQTLHMLQIVFAWVAWTVMIGWI